MDKEDGVYIEEGGVCVCVCDVYVYTHIYIWNIPYMEYYSVNKGTKLGHL